MPHAPWDLRPIADAACLTWVRGVEPFEVLRRAGARPPLGFRTLEEVDAALVALYDPLLRSGLPRGGVAGWVDDDWTLLVEPNGLLGTRTDALLRIAADTDAVSVFWNVNALAEVAVVRDGALAAVLPDLVFWVPADDAAPESGLADVEGDAEEVRELVDALAGARGFGWRDAVFPWVARRTGAPLTAEWLAERHLSAVFTAPVRRDG